MFLCKDQVYCSRVADRQLGEVTTEYKVSQSFTEALAAEKPQAKIPLGHQLDDFILECSYRGRKCKNMWVSMVHGQGTAIGFSSFLD